MKRGVNKTKESTTGKYLQTYAKRYLPLGILSFLMVLTAQSIMLMPPLIMRNVMDKQLINGLWPLRVASMHMS